MKKIKVLLVLSLLMLGLVDTKINAEEPTYGNVFYGNETIDSIHSFGVVTLDKTTVLGKVQVNGRLEALNSTLGSIQVKGKVNLKNCVVKNTVTIAGALIAQQTEFQNKISISSHEISFSKCTVGSIEVNSDKEFQSTQIIEARNGTIIGSVSFDSGYGEVWLYNGSRVSGQVKGGKIIQK